MKTDASGKNVSFFFRKSEKNDITLIKKYMRHKEDLF
jgi:hypothetical protein